jgi:hypothetical protein
MNSFVVEPANNRPCLPDPPPKDKKRDTRWIRWAPTAARILNRFPGRHYPRSCVLKVVMPSFQIHEQEVIKEENTDLLLPAVKESKKKAFILGVTLFMG